MTIKEFKRMVKTKIGIQPESQRLIYAGKQLEDDNTLADYAGLNHMSTIFLVLRLVGGSEKRPFPAGLPVSDDCCTICLETPALAMPCKPVKHPYCPDCLMEYCWSEIGNDRLKTVIACSLCSTEWDLGVIKRYGGASEEEIRLLSESLSENVIHSDSDIMECPGCGSFSEHKDKRMSRVICLMCKKEDKKPDFCWHCRKSWSNKSSDYDCGNDSCKATGILAQIQNAPKKTISGVSCPSIRLCPTCGASIEYNSGCKQMTCKECKTKFCFICLRKPSSGSWQCGSYRCNPAPVQTRVPRKNV